MKCDCEKYYSSARQILHLKIRLYEHLQISCSTLCAGKYKQGNNFKLEGYVEKQKNTKLHAVFTLSSSTFLVNLPSSSITLPS
jgi:hypothetical protein